MNLADAIRQAAQSAGGAFSEPRGGVVMHEPQVAAPIEEPNAIDAVTAEPVRAPDPPALVPSGNVVRMELFLSPEQLSGLFRAVVASQHSVMTLREAAAYLRISPAALEQMATEGTIPAFNIEGRWRFPKSSVDEWVTLNTFRSEDSDDAA